MRTQSADTGQAAERVLIDLARKASFPEKFSQVRSLSQTVMQLSRRAIARANPELTPRQIDIRFVACHYGETLASQLEEYLCRNGSHENA